MKNINFKFLALIIGLIFTACTDSNPNIDSKGEDQLKSRELNYEISENSMQYNDVIYVPIYSDIYIDAQTQKNLLAATLSIRNTNFKDSLYLFKIDYYNTEGSLVRKYIDRPISLPPMATLNYVVEKEDDTGGAGANFIIELSANSVDVKPLIQAIMVESSGNKAFAFSTDGYSIKH